MPIVCHICKKEVEIMSFGTGFVGICCDKVMYNSTFKSQFDVKPDVKKDISMHQFRPGRQLYKAKHS
ncbi:MAG TPA: hypothetical protein VMT12_01235 [Syntrophales bacterium]|nr:hypothetical protein [Syntrophales bacterium]